MDVQKSTYTVEEAGVLTGRRTKQVWRDIAEGNWPTRVIRIGKRIYVPKADLDRLLGLDRKTEAA